MKRRYHEDAIQRAVCNHLRARANHGLVWWHTPNGGQRNPFEGARFKSLGVTSGVADLMLLYNKKFYALELKSPKGRASEAQLTFLSAVDKAGGYTSIAYGIDEALDALTLWGLIRPDLSAIGRPAPTGNKLDSSAGTTPDGPTVRLTR